MCGPRLEPSLLHLAAPPLPAGRDAGPLLPKLPTAHRPGKTHSRTVRVLPCAAGVPLYRHGGLPPVLRDVEANPGPPPPDWGEVDHAVLPDLVREACSRLGIAPVRDAFATATNCRFPAFWSKAEGAFAQAWDYPSAGPLWANPPFSGLDEVKTKASREGSLMLVVAPECGGPGYPWWAALCALCPRRWNFPDGRPVYLRGGTERMPSPRWRTWAFLVDSRPHVVPGPAAVPSAVTAALALTNPPLSVAEGAPGPRTRRGPHGCAKTCGHLAIDQQAEAGHATT